MKYAVLTGLTCLIVFTVVGCANQSKQPASKEGSTNSGVATGNSVATASNENRNNSTTTSYSQSQLASMSPDQLALSAQKNGIPLPFASQDITRRALSSELTANNPSSGSAFPNNFGNGNFYVVDQWSGTIQGKAFKLEVDMKPDRTEYIIGMTSGITTSAVNLDEQPWITSFTGSYVVFASPNPAQGNQMFAINLTTGDILKDSSMVRQMSGILSKGGYPTHIGGLAKSYDVFPNSVPYSEQKAASVVTWKFNSITVTPTQMTVNHQLLHAFRYVTSLTLTDNSLGVVDGQRFSLRMQFSGETQKLLGVSQVSVPLLLQNRTSSTYTAIWESVYQPSYPTGTLNRLSGNTNDVTVKVLPSN